MIEGQPMAQVIRRPSQSEISQPVDRMRTASAKAREAFSAVARRAKRLSEELDELTVPSGTIAVELHEEDSAVVVVREMIGSLTPPKTS